MWLLKSIREKSSKYTHFRPNILTHFFRKCTNTDKNVRQTIFFRTFNRKSRWEMWKSGTKGAKFFRGGSHFSVCHLTSNVSFSCQFAWNCSLCAMQRSVNMSPNSKVWPRFCQKFLDQFRHFFFSKVCLCTLVSVSHGIHHQVWDYSLD